jgi:hypothetical protein
MVPLALALRKNCLIEELNLYDNNIGKKGAAEMIETIAQLKYAWLSAFFIFFIFFIFLLLLSFWPQIVV